MEIQIEDKSSGIDHITLTLLFREVNLFLSITSINRPYILSTFKELNNKHNSDTVTIKMIIKIGMFDIPPNPNRIVTIKNKEREIVDNFSLSFLRLFSFIYLPPLSTFLII